MNALEAIYSLPVSLMATVYRSHHSNQERAWVCISHCCPVPIFQSDSGSSAIFGVLCEDSYPRIGNASTYGLNITQFISQSNCLSGMLPTLLKGLNGLHRNIQHHSYSWQIREMQWQSYPYTPVPSRQTLQVIGASLIWRCERRFFSPYNTSPSSKVSISQIPGWESIFCWVFF